ncbi:MAG: hypothetical protein LBC41_04690 [Clostridiales bacterium]|jgi:tetratricopeptide (TPR) repeat protein|nr:hypothetical protein [Clostridiales bacterium]
MDEIMIEENLKMIFGCLNQAMSLANKQEFDKSMATFDKADELLKDLDVGDYGTEVKAMLLEGRSSALRELGKEEESLQLCLKAVAVRRTVKIDNKFRQNTSDLALATVLVRLGRIEEAVAVADGCLDVSGYSNDFQAAVHLAELATIVYSADLPNNYNKTKKRLQKARTLLLPHASNAGDYLLDIQHTLGKIAYEYEQNKNSALFELEKGWSLVEKLGIVNFAYQRVLHIAVYASDVADASNQKADYWKWRKRYNEVFGVHISKGDADFDMFKNYLDSNMNSFLGLSELDDSVTIERVLLSVIFMRNSTDKYIDYAHAQWFAGCVLAEKDKSREGTRKSIRLIKSALQAIKEEKGEVPKGMAAVGKGYIASYHFNREEYDLAAEWYQDAKKDLQTTNSTIRARNEKRFADSLAECLKRM